MPAWSGFWNGLYGENYALTTNNLGNTRRGYARMLHGYGEQPYNRIIRQLVAGNVGGTAAGGYTRVTHSAVDPMALGGKRTIENKLTINRPTTAADQAKIDKDLVYKWSPTFPRDKSGNGGGGQRGL